MAHEFQNGEEDADESGRRRGDESDSWPTSNQWPVVDRVPAQDPARTTFATDDSDAPVSLDDQPAAGVDVAEDADRDEDRVTPATDWASRSAEAAEDDEDGEEGSTSDPTDSPDDDLVELRNAGARDIDATTVSITQGGARDVEATTVTINQGGAARIRADEVRVSQGGIGLARADNLTIEEGGTAFAVIAENARLDADTSVFLLVAGSTTGDVRPFLDWRAAAAFGAGFALILSVLRRGRR